MDVLWAEGFPGGSVVKNLPANTGDMQKMRVRSLGRADSLEEEMATHSTIIAWRILWTEESTDCKGLIKQQNARALSYT